MNPRNLDGSEITVIPEGSHKRILFNCDICGEQVEQEYRNYVKQKDNKLCRSCRNKETAKNPSVKLKQSNFSKQMWKDKPNKALSVKKAPRIKKKVNSIIQAPVVPQKDEEIYSYLLSIGLDVKVEDGLLFIPSVKTYIKYSLLSESGELSIKNKKYHYNLLMDKIGKGCKLITIFDDEWIKKNDIVKNRLKHILVKESNLYARNCDIREISNKDAKDFVDKIHIQGYVSCAIKLGAFHKDTLVAVMTFAKGSISKGNTTKEDVFELSRFCVEPTVVGIASKLLKYFQRNYYYNEIFSYADRRWSDGNLYRQIGFNFISYTQPNYFYFKVGGEIKRFHRYNFRKDKIKHLATVEGQTEWEIMQETGWDRIFDCGNIKLNIINTGDVE